jgi:hypothetical protein
MTGVSGCRSSRQPVGARAADFTAAASLPMREQSILLQQKRIIETGESNHLRQKIRLLHHH